MIFFNGIISNNYNSILFTEIISYDQKTNVYKSEPYKENYKRFFLGDGYWSAWLFFTQLYISFHNEAVPTDLDFLFILASVFFNNKSPEYGKTTSSGY